VYFAAVAFLPKWVVLFPSHLLGGPNLLQFIHYHLHGRTIASD
jgi:hypothetical protein